MASRRKKLCLITQYWSPDVVGDATRVRQVAAELQKLGCDVAVITTQPHYPRGDRKGMKFRVMSASYEGKMLVFRLGMPGLSHSGFGNRFLLYSWFALASFLPSIVLGKGRVHWVFSQRVFATYPALVVRFLFRRTIVSDATDIWPEAVVNTGLIEPNSTVFRLGRFAAKVAYKASSRISTMTERMREFLVARYGVAPGKILVIPYAGRRLNTVEPPLVGSFTVLYFGNLGLAYDFEVVLKAASEMRQEDVNFVIRGGGELLGRLQKEKEEMKLEKLRFIPEPVNEGALSALVSSANVLVLPIRKSAFPDVSFPGKLVEYIQSGRPTIVVGEGYPAELVAKNQVGLTVSSGDYNGLSGAIRSLKGDVATASRISANAKRMGSEKFGERALNESLKQLLAEVP